jgi:hypothetical protein
MNGVLQIPTVAHYCDLTKNACLKKRIQVFAAPHLVNGSEMLIQKLE